MIKSMTVLLTIWLNKWNVFMLLIIFLLFKSLCVILWFLPVYGFIMFVL